MLELAFISPPDIAVVMIVALLVFGPNKLPEVGRQVGQFIREGKKMMSSFTDAMNDVKGDVESPFKDRTIPSEIVEEPEKTDEKPDAENADRPHLKITGPQEADSKPESESEEKSTSEKSG